MKHHSKKNNNKKHT